MMLHYIFILYRLPATGAGASHYNCTTIFMNLNTTAFSIVRPFRVYEKKKQKNYDWLYEDGQKLYANGNI